MLCELPAGFSERLDERSADERRSLLFERPGQCGLDVWNVDLAERDGGVAARLVVRVGKRGDEEGAQIAVGMFRSQAACEGDEPGSGRRIALACAFDRDGTGRQSYPRDCTLGRSRERAAGDHKVEQAGHVADARGVAAIVQGALEIEVWLSRGGHVAG